MDSEMPPSAQLHKNWRFRLIFRRLKTLSAGLFLAEKLFVGIFLIVPLFLRFYSPEFMFCRVLRTFCLPFLWLFGKQGLFWAFSCFSALIFLRWQ
ncbi:MAG: hypothetical protein HY394_03490 [Candidatus Diapherotrites archaeon]|nr:hypothetical protein [Candidatus Diapherotrites archaeon]